MRPCACGGRCGECARSAPNVLRNISQLIGAIREPDGSGEEDQRPMCSSMQQTKAVIPGVGEEASRNAAACKNLRSFRPIKKAAVIQLPG
jgi:hypothetical protein